MTRSEPERGDDQPPGQAVSQYFSASPSGPEHRRQLDVEVWGRRFALTSANGVFAGDGLDRGTEILLRESAPPTGEPTVLDLGCGYGPVALAIALACPGARVDAIDVNERALALCRDNAAGLGVADRVRVLLPEQVEAGRTYDEIWSNPPIRIGKEALHALLLTWLPRLRPGGSGRLVVSKNLGADTLQRWLVDQGFGCERAASSKGFRVLVVGPRAV
ncbi:MAG: class I SAM-dependent methyltransferase [Janthinobacterium lividum]